MERREEECAIEYWERVFESFQPYEVKDDEKFVFLKPITENLAGKKVLEIGCGRGEMSVFLAKKGAAVVAIDNTENAVQCAQRLADFNKVSLDCRKLDAMQIDELEDTYDYVVGKYVLHHIEPFSEFVPKMSCVLKEGGIGLFWENSDANKLLMLCRNYLVGRFGIPRHGDGVEIPFQAQEIAMLKTHFKTVNVVYLEMLFWRMLGTYIFRKNKKIQTALANLDSIFYKYLPIFNRYSYNQVIRFE